jgi:hypothetical protein
MRMRKDIVGLIGSIAVNVVLAGIGLLVNKGDVLLYAGVIGVALTAILWIWSWAFAPPPREEEAESERRSRRRKMLNDSREMAARHELQTRWDWRQTARYTSAFFDIRPHLSADYMKRLADTRRDEVPEPGMPEPLVAAFLDELDRLEREWKLS